MKSKSYLYSINLILTLLMFASCGNEVKNEEPVSEVKPGTITLNESQIKNAGLAYDKPSRKPVSAILKVNGKIEAPPQNLVSVSVPLGGFLKSTKLMPGMPVKKGEVIAVMEDQQFIQLQQEYLTSKEKLKYLEKEFQRQKELNEGKASSDKIFQQTEADYKSERIATRSLEEKLRLIGIDPARLTDSNLSRSISITSPINGFVAKVNGNIGKYVEPSMVLFELVNPEDIHLSLTVFEKDLDKLYLGQKLRAYTNHNPEKKYDCEIILIGMNLSEDRSVEVHCHFEQYDHSLIPGMYMNADIEVKSKQALVLPESAVVEHENKKFVFRSTSKGSYEMEEVKTGISEDGYTEVTSIGDTAGTYVTKGAYTLLMALKNRSEE